MNELSLFSGIGGGILASKFLGFNVKCAVEINEYRRNLLLLRQNQGILPPFPIWDDITTFPSEEWKGYIDLVSGGFPCQDISIAGGGEGLQGTRSCLWYSMLSCIRTIRPKIVFVENVPALTSRGLGDILSDFSQMGYNALWSVISAKNLGALHKRERIWIMAYPHCYRFQWKQLPDRCRAWQAHLKGSFGTDFWEKIRFHFASISDNLPEPVIFGKNHGVSNRVDRTKGIGDSQVPQVAAVAFLILFNEAYKLQKERG